jgi:hypothetical protein
MRKLLLITALITLASVAWSLAATYNQNPIKDTWVWDQEAWSHNGTELRTNRVSVWNQRILMQFDLSSLPSSVTINSATLYAYNYEEYGGSETGELYRITQSWTEDTYTFPSYDSNLYATTDLGGSYSWKTFDITTLVQEWADGTYDNYGLIFFGTTGAGYYIRFYARESTYNPPYLLIDYTDTTAVQPTSLGHVKAMFN